MCSANRCGAYGKSGAALRAAEPWKNAKNRVTEYDVAVVALTVTRLEDSFDFEGMAKGSRRHKELFQKAMAALRAKGERFLPLGAGGCPDECKTCTYPDAPCRFPEKFTVSMEAYGMMVSEVCKDCGLRYCGGNNTLTYVSMILL